MTPASHELTVVRNQVRSILEQSPAWRELDPDKRRALARDMVKVSSFLAQDPGWLDSATPSQEEPIAEALGPVDQLKQRLARAPGQVGQDFQAGAMRQGVEEFGNLVGTVDFPEFVSGLIQGVFQAIVDASIQQMEAYGELLAATAKTVDQFASDHISDDAAREQAASRFPSILRIERSEGGGSRLVQRDDADDQKPLQDYASSTESIDFADPASERAFVTKAKLEMARQRQKLMALMVMLGINRIIVTNGRINAKVVFDIAASDAARRAAASGMTSSTSRTISAGGAGWAPWGAGGASAQHRHKTTVRSSIDDSSESKAEMKARLSGDVRVNFRSETLPPERMLDALQFERINYMAQPGGAPAAGESAASTNPQGGRS